MKNRIRNILLEALISESPLFTAVAIKVDGRVYRGTYEDTHSSLTAKIFGEDWYDKHAEGDNYWGKICGFIDVNGNFVSRSDARSMVDLPSPDYNPESGMMRYKKELVDFEGQDIDGEFDGFEKT
jgi:hypothetical protein